MQFTKSVDFYFTNNITCTYLNIPDAFIEACEHIWKNRKRLQNEYDNGFKVFDFPDYGGMNSKASNTLSGDVVDFVQDIIMGNQRHKLTEMKKKQFMRNMIGRYLCDC